MARRKKFDPLKSYRKWKLKRTRAQTAKLRAKTAQENAVRANLKARQKAAQGGMNPSLAYDQPKPPRKRASKSVSRETTHARPAAMSNDESAWVFDPPAPKKRAARKPPVSRETNDYDAAAASYALGQTDVPPYSPKPVSRETRPKSDPRDRKSGPNRSEHENQSQAYANPERFNINGTNVNVASGNARIGAQIGQVNGRSPSVEDDGRYDYYAPEPPKKPRIRYTGPESTVNVVGPNAHVGSQHDTIDGDVHVTQTTDGTTVRIEWSPNGSDDTHNVTRWGQAEYRKAGACGAPTKDKTRCIRRVRPGGNCGIPSHGTGNNG
jgi:hypothetical protein